MARGIGCMYIIMRGGRIDVRNCTLYDCSFCLQVRGTTESLPGSMSRWKIFSVHFIYLVLYNEGGNSLKKIIAGIGGQQLKTQFSG